MNRTERLFAVREELRRRGRAGTTGRRLAQLLEVSERTIKRDVAALQLAGTPVWAQSGPGGGYVLDAAASLPPVNFSPSQAVAVSVALALLPDGGPFGADATAARGKVWDALAPADRARAEALAARVWIRSARDVVRHDRERDGDSAGGDAGAEGDKGAERATGVRRAASPSVLRAVEQAVGESRVLAITYRAVDGTLTRRHVEPVLLGWTGDDWHLIGWCRLRGAMRWFRLSRIEQASLTQDVCVPRDVADVGRPPADAGPVAGP